MRGQILPVLDPFALVGDAPAEPRSPRPGDPIVVVELGPVRAALWVDKVLGVADGDDTAEPFDVGALFDRLRQPAAP